MANQDVGQGRRPWSQEYEDLLREFLPDGARTARLSPTDGLLDLGLDSFGTVELLVALESAFDVKFPDDALTAETFATVGSLWTILSSLVAADGHVGLDPRQ